MHHLRDLNWCLDQAANMSVKIPVLGSAFGILLKLDSGAAVAGAGGLFGVRSVPFG
jgi:hypothetical protein